RKRGRARAEQLAHTLAESFAEEIPDRAVHAGDGLEQDLAITLRVRQREHGLPDPLALEDARAPDARRELVAKDARDLGSVRAVVAVVDLADQPVVRTQARNHRAALAHVIGAAAEVLLQRDVERDGLDGVYAHRVLL